MNHSAAAASAHRHGSRVHEHPHRGPHRHLTAPRRSRALAPDHHAGAHRRDSPRPPGHAHAHSHGHTHGLVHEDIKRSREGIRAVLCSLAVLALAAAAQAVAFAASSSVALLADMVHNFGDALTAVPLAIAFALRSPVAERRAGVAVVVAILISACVAGVEAVQRLVHPAAPSHLGVIALAGAIGLLGNLAAARIRTSAGRRLHSAALIADGDHARADAYLSAAVSVSAGVVALGLRIADPLIGLLITAVILRITWRSWLTVRGHAH